MKGEMTRTKEEIKNTIEAKGAEFGFEIEKTQMTWGVTGKTATIQIFTETDYEKTDWENKTACVKVTASAFISSMGGNPDPEELLKAADEIARAAKFAKAINEMELAFTKKF